MGRLTLVFHPDGVRRVLQENHLNYNKDIPDYRILSLVLGKGLLTNDGESWLQQRRLMQPAFHRDRIADFGTLITEATATWLDKLETAQAKESGSPLDIPQEMSRLTLSIVCKALFGADLPAEALKRVSRALTMANHLLAEAFYLPGILSLPTPQRHRLPEARRELHAVVDTIIQQRRTVSEPRGDLLAMLLDARDAETGLCMSDHQLRDEVLTLLLAGYETTANTLSWTFTCWRSTQTSWQISNRSMDMYCRDGHRRWMICHSSRSRAWSSRSRCASIRPPGQWAAMPCKQTTSAATRSPKGRMSSSLSM